MGEEKEQEVEEEEEEDGETVVRRWSAAMEGGGSRPKLSNPSEGSSPPLQVRFAHLQPGRCRSLTLPS